ncbi:MAG: sodium:solute symporter family protein [Melioribacteraceae bacterium]|nr:sodium:solute symporter family protein [Melioribacteraceae bacterium]
MVSFAVLDIVIIILFFLIVILIGFFAGRNDKDSADGFLLSGRKVGLTLFILTTVSTWYGGILGVGEFSYRYGVASWFTQGFPYYVFAIIFALLFAKKINKSKLYTIPDKIEETYGKTAGLLTAILIFILVSPAPYLLMVGNLLTLIFDIPIFISLILGLLISIVYLLKSGYKADLYTDVFQFFVMFIGFIIICIVAVSNFGGIKFLSANLPAQHLTLSGGNSFTFILVWFFIALWTFTDPGFHQRCYSAKNGGVAKKGIIISVGLWILFDFLTNTTGLYTVAILPNLENPVNAFPMLAEKILSPGLKGIFYAALFATIISTLNSFLFLSATTFGRDFIFKYTKAKDESKIPNYTRIGLAITAVIAVIMALLFPSVIELWYTVGSICIPGIIFLIFGAYYSKLRINNNYAIAEILAGSISSSVWYFLRPQFIGIQIIYEIEPMIVGLAAAGVVHLTGILKKDF